MAFQSIRWRLVLSYVLITVLTVSMVGILALTLLDEFIRMETQTRLETNAQVIAQQAYSLLEPFPRVDQLRELTQTMAFLGNVRVRILDDRYNVVIDSGPPEQTASMVWLQTNPENQEEPAVFIPLSPGRSQSAQPEKWMRENAVRRQSMVIRVSEGPWGRIVMIDSVEQIGERPLQLPTPRAVETDAAGVQTDAQMVRSVRAPIGDPNRPLGFVQLDSSRAPDLQILQAMRRALLLAGLSAALIAVAAGLWVSRGLTAPIQALAGSAARMSSGDLSVRAPVHGAGEIGQLAEQFNHMAERLQASFTALSNERDTLRRFIGDASHELRTPITALSSFIELLQGPAAQDSTARDEFLSESQAQVRRMEWITANLLDLSRLDSGLAHLDLQPAALESLLRSSAAPFMPRAQEEGIRLVLESPTEDVEIVCDRARIEMAVGNLLHNALKFTPAGGQIGIRGNVEDGMVLIQVEDNGAGIAADDIPHIFERFYRGKASGEGAGLGLAIVQSIAQAHGGYARVESQPGAGSRFQIILPMLNEDVDFHS
jgi:signal transduction histidine kinase